MKNKKVKLGVLVMAAVTLFTATAFAANTGNEGYEALKEIMKDSKRTEALTSASLNGSFQVSDNGTIITAFTGKVKANHEEDQISGDVQIDLKGKKQDLSFFHKDDEVYLSDNTNTKYYKLENVKKDHEKRRADYNREEYAGHDEMGTTEEALLDYFVGDLKSQFELTKNGDGSKTITMDLDQNEVPAAFNLLMAAAVGNEDEASRHNKSEMSDEEKQLLVEKLPFMKDLIEADKDLLPVLKQNVKITALLVKFNVDSENQIKSFETKLSISGSDANGVYHEVSFQGAVTISDINITKVEQFDRNGKNIEIINAEEFKCSRK